MISIVIPAHNEEGVIERCLRSLTDGMEPGEFQIIVVCNGCTDRTAELARAFGPEVEVVETEIGNKSYALNLGDERAEHFPRFYVDADVRLEPDSIRRVAEVLRGGEIHAASPALHQDFSACTAPVRAFYSVWQRLPYYREQLVGGGVYALSAEGRSVFGEFPDLLAEDEYIRLLLPESQRGAVKGAHFTNYPPTHLRALVRLRARQLRGNRHFKARYPEIVASESRSYRQYLLPLASRPRFWPGLMLYTAVYALTHTLAWWQHRCGKGTDDWDRDISSRGA